MQSGRIHGFPLQGLGERSQKLRGDDRGTRRQGLEDIYGLKAYGTLRRFDGLHRQHELVFSGHIQNEPIAGGKRKGEDMLELPVARSLRRHPVRPGAEAGEYMEAIGLDYRWPALALNPYRDIARRLRIQIVEDLHGYGNLSLHSLKHH